MAPAAPAPPAVAIAGPTCSGKSALALALARAVGGQVVNADSMQMYGALRILTARPSEEDCARAPHRLYGVLDAARRCSAGRWRRMAAAEVGRAARRGVPTVLCGGTGLYLEALRRGIAPVPEVPEAVRAETDALLAAEGPGALHARLAGADPALAARLRPSDRQRVARGWEVWRATGRPLSAWQADGAEGGLAFHAVLLEPPRGALREAIAARFDRMLAAGALEEARAFGRLALPPRAPVAKAHGVRPLLAHLRGEVTLGEAAGLATAETRRYARRQRTWFRRRYGADETLALAPEEAARDADALAARIAAAAGLRRKGG